MTSAFWTVLQVARPIGAAITAALAARFGVPTVLVLMGLASVSIALLGMLTAARVRWPEAQGGLPPTEPAALV